PTLRGLAASWSDVDRQVTEALNAARAAKHKVVLLSTTLTSPSTRQIIAEFAEHTPGFHHVVYDPVSLSAMRIANAQSFGRAVIPHYAFDKARVIVALEADFLGTWLSPVEFSRQYARTRKEVETPALHVQFESGLSVTGSNADVRVPVAPSDLGAVA